MTDQEYIERTIDNGVKHRIQKREEDFWKAAFLQSLIGAAAGGYTASAVTGAATAIANQSLEHYRKFHDKLYFEEEFES